MIIAEGDDFCRHIVRLLCQSEFGHDLVGLARDGQQAVDLIDTTEPDLLILDLYLSKHNGFDVAAFARRRCPKIKIIAFTAARGRYTVQQIERAGFDAYVDKGDHAVDCLRNAVRAVTEDPQRPASRVDLKHTPSED